MKPEGRHGLRYKNRRDIYHVPPCDECSPDWKLSHLSPVGWKGGVKRRNKRHDEHPDKGSNKAYIM